MIQNYLVTGGAGFIGSHLIEHLLQLGHNVICLDNFDDYYSSFIKEENLAISLQHNNFTLIKGSITDREELHNIFLIYSINTVIHLAAKAGVRPSIRNPLEYYKTNVEGTLQILECMKEHNVKRIIYASSSSVYGNNARIPFVECANVDKPISPYAASKKAGELLCYTYHELYDFDVFCLRFFTVYGPRQRPDLAIHSFTDKILNNQPIQLFGDGSTCRDYTYIDDIIQGILNAVCNLNGYEIFNIGESQTISLNQMISIIEKHLNKKAIKEILPMQSGDVHTTYADISKAQNRLNYFPKWTFEDGIVEFIKWKLK